jgi:hypothetical protein
MLSASASTTFKAMLATGGEQVLEGCDNYRGCAAKGRETP